MRSWCKITFSILKLLQDLMNTTPTIYTHIYIYIYIYIFDERHPTHTHSLSLSLYIYIYIVFIKFFLNFKLKRK